MRAHTRVCVHINSTHKLYIYFNPQGRQSTSPQTPACLARRDGLISHEKRTAVKLTSHHRTARENGKITT